MFNQPRPLRPAKPWQSTRYLRSSREEEPFSAAQWTEAQPAAFADTGMPSGRNDFSADSYAPMTEPLSAQAKKALALLDAEHSHETFAQEKDASEDGSSTNAHLPFVLDVYKSRAGKPLHAAKAAPVEPPCVTDDASPQPAVALAEMAQAAAAETADEPVLQAPAPAEPQTTPTAEVVAEDGSSVPEVPTHDALAHEAQAHEVEAHEVEAHEVGAQVQAEQAEPAASATDVEPVAESEPEPEPEPEPIQPGISAEEVAQREADHFAQGMKQGVDQGMALGEQQARQAMADEVAAQCALLAQVTQGLQTLMADSTQFFEPLKRLSLHLAEQLVRGELTVSGQAVERLVQHCLDEVSHPLQDGAVVELNPDDKKILQAQGGEFLHGLRLEANHELQAGSVRVFANDMVVEDLIEHRLQALAKNLLLDVPSWEKQSALVQPAPSTDHTEHDDDPA